MRIDASKVIELFGNCEYKYYLSYVEGIPQGESNKWLKTGKAVHQIISDYYKDLTEQQVLNNRTVLKRFMMGKLSPIIDKYKEDELREAIKKNISGFIWFEVTRVREYENVYGTDYRDILPVLNEEKIVVEVKGDEFVGVVDIGFRFNRKVTIYDWKTSSSDESSIENEIQLHFYQYLHENKLHSPVYQLGNVFTKTRHVTLFDMFEDNDKFVLDMIRDYKAKVASGDFKKTGKFCEYCSYLDLCSG